MVSPQCARRVLILRFTRALSPAASLLNEAYDPVLVLRDIDKYSVGIGEHVLAVAARGD